MNFFTDAILQPAITGVIELTLWIAIFATAQTETIGGFGKESYLSYVLWTAFIARLTSSWMYEFRMIEEVESGSINGLLVRPMSYFEYYLSQLLGYKFIITVFTLIFPLILSQFFNFPIIWERLPGTLTLIFYYLVLVHILSFVISTVAFHLNKIYSLTVAKNLGLWLFTGELFPLDLLPEPWKTIILNLPFANAVYIPVGYLTGRIGNDMLLHGFMTNTAGIVVLGTFGYGMWKWGLSKYAGTGA